MKVVLDTNIIVADFNLKKPAAKILLEQSKTGMLDVYVPEVVLDEVVNKFRQRIDQAVKNVTSELSIIARLNDEEGSEPFEDGFLETSATAYGERLKQLLSDHDVTVMPYPETDHRFLAKKAMLKKKPFSDSEKGYRDNLIWENVKSLISGVEEEIASNPELVFITNNSSDFMSGDGLHDDLIEELQDQDLNTETISVYKSLQDFSDRVMKLYLVQEDMVRDKLSDERSGGSILRTILVEYFYKEYVRHDLSEFEFTAPGDYNDNGEREITAFHEDFKIQDLQVKKLSADEFVVDMRIDLETELEFYVDKSEYYSSADVDYGIIDYDWNDHVMLAGATENIPFALTLIVNSKLESLGIEMNLIE